MATHGHCWLRSMSGHTRGYSHRFVGTHEFAWLMPNLSWARTRWKADKKKHEDAKDCVEQVLSSITTAGYDSLYGFVDELLNIRDQQISARVSRMLGRHGNDILNSIWARQPSLVNDWVNLVSGEILTQEGQKLVNYTYSVSNFAPCLGKSEPKPSWTTSQRSELGTS